MFRIAICDDEPVFSSQIETIINYWSGRPADTQTEIFHDGDALIAAHSREPFDIILLDVLMPLLNGIETAAEIRTSDKDVKIIFLTASSEFALDSYSVKASNYLLKPVDPSRLITCLNELNSEIHQMPPGISVKGLHAVHRVKLMDIEYVEAQNKHVVFALSSKMTIESPSALYLYEDKLTLDDGFFKCHRSYIVNIHHIDMYTTKEIRMRSGAVIPVSRGYHKDFEAAYFSVLFGKAGEK